MVEQDGKHITAADRFAFHVELIVGAVGLVALLGTALARTRLDADTAAILFGIGSSLLATAISTYLSGAANRRIISTLQGLGAVYKRRAAVHEDVYREHIASATRRIWVQGCELHRFLQRNEKALEDAARRGVEVRLLVMSQSARVSAAPQTELSFSALRKYEEHQDWHIGNATHAENGNSHEGIRRFVDQVNRTPNYGGSSKTAMQAKEYFSTSSSMLFILDDSAYVGPYLHNLDSGESPTFFIRRGPLFDRFATHFDNLWNDSRFAVALPSSRAHAETGSNA